MRKRGRRAEKYIYLWVIVIILMMGWDSPDSLFESEPLPQKAERANCGKFSL